jgi:prevent-host-death family protein
METVAITEAKMSLSRLVTRLERGEVGEVVITRAGRPVAKLVPVAATKGVRLGIAKGAFSVPDDIDTHNAEVACTFTGK